MKNGTERKKGPILCERSRNGEGITEVEWICQASDINSNIMSELKIKKVFQADCEEDTGSVATGTLLLIRKL